MAACFAGGADIVVCGRVSDASLAVGAAMWWHGWTRADLPALAGALMVGHIIECGTYATGGYYSGFKALAPAWTDFGCEFRRRAACRVGRGGMDDDDDDDDDKDQR